MKIQTGTAGELELGWEGASPTHSKGLIIYQLEQSEDLQDWSSVGDRIRSSSTDELHLRSVAMTRARMFYRVLAREDLLGIGGGEVFGYGDRLAREPWTEEERQFFNSMIQEDGWIPQGCTIVGPTYDGWYPQLFYRPVYAPDTFSMDYGADKDDKIVADVHTDLPDEIVGDPGAVLHEGLGQPNLLFLVADCGQEKVILDQQLPGPG